MLLYIFPNALKLDTGRCKWSSIAISLHSLGEDTSPLSRCEFSMNGVNLILSFRRPAMYTLSFRHHVLAQIARGSRGSRSFCVKRPPTPNQSIYVSKSTDPYFNLTLEDWYAIFCEPCYFCTDSKPDLEGCSDTKHQMGLCFLSIGMTHVLS